MDAEKKTVSKSGHKKGTFKKRKTKKYRLVKFDKERFFIILGIGFVSAVIGLWIIWTTKSAPEGASQPIGHTTAESFSWVLPESTLDMLVFILGNLFVLFGVVCIFICLKLVVQYIAGKFQIK